LYIQLSIRRASLSPGVRTDFSELSKSRLVLAKSDDFPNADRAFYGNSAKVKRFPYET